jgi:hypothetical protein
MARSIVLLCLSFLLLAWFGISDAGLETGFFNPYLTTGPRIAFNTMTPAVRKWYLPQTLYYLYDWKNWEYTNYAKENYQRYVDVFIEGTRFYDLYGNYVTKGWRIYDWTQAQPTVFGSSIWKAPQFASWFNRLLISSTSKGQFYVSLTIGEAIRSSLTPLTFSKPLFDGIQWDFSSDKYGATILASRVNNTAPVAITQTQSSSSATTFTNLLGFRGTVQVGDFVRVGGTYVNASHGNSAISIGKNSLRGVLSGALNGGNVRRIVLRLSDDSPEDSRGGALLFRERIFINGIEHPEVKPLISGGVRRQGLLEANGADVVTLTYDIERDFRAGLSDKITDFKEIREIDFELVIANDYRVEATSNMQTNNAGEPAFLPVAKASGNIRDGSNQQVIRFRYGLPTANQVAGMTFEISDIAGLDLRAEYAVNTRFRRFPNQNIRTNQALASNSARAFYVTGSKMSYPWFAYGEIFSMDPGYNTSMLIPDGRGFIDYENLEFYQYEFVDDNDDQDEFPDWRRRYTGGDALFQSRVLDTEVFPGLDENNDLVDDFNQNRNSQPDYVEPFLRYNVDPPEFLFGMDMNNNTVIDRFENDTEPDYPYKRDHRGYNFYTGVEVIPDSRLIIGRSNEWLLSSNRKSRSTYGLFTLQANLGRPGVQFRVMDWVRTVKDNIPDDLIQWVQTPLSAGSLQDVTDPLIAQNTLINTTYLDVNYTRFAPLNIVGKFKYEIYHQRGSQSANTRDERLLGVINKADYPVFLGKNFTLWPKWKQTYMRRVPTDRSKILTNELSEIFFLMEKYVFTRQFWLESGIEYEIFRNLLEKPKVPPPNYIDDFRRITLAAQLASVTDYLGYKLTSHIGAEWDQQRFEEVIETNLVVFVRVFAGAQ